MIKLTVLIAGLSPLTSTSWAQLANSPWPKWQRDLRNSGWTPAVGPSEPRVKWAIDFHGISLQPGPAIGAEGELYIGWSICFQPKFISMVRGGFWRCAWFSRVSTEGDVEWERPLSDYYASFATLDARDRVFVVDGWFEDRYTESHSYAFTRDGRALWGPRRNPPYSNYSLSHMTIGRDGTIFYPDGDTLRAFDPGNGIELWHRYLGQQSSAYECPSIGEGGTVFVAGDSSLLALDPGQGSILWSVEGPRPSDTTPTSIGLDGTVYVGFNSRDESLLTAVSPAGQILWQIAPAGRPSFPPSIDSRGRLYLQTRSPLNGVLLEAYNRDGTPRWVTSTPGNYSNAVVLDGNDNVYCATLEGYPWVTSLFSYTSEGEFRWEFSEATSALPRYQAPVIGPDGTIYLMVDVGGSEDDIMRFYAFGPGEAPDPAWVGRLKP
ncbi:MAG: PQQ-like beta-propeller repeat protein [Phycisphaerales bacterium]|nr:PQQ-like beta-propeller repeat protein [Phycisphaerales bacterium]